MCSGDLAHRASAPGCMEAERFLRSFLGPGDRLALFVRHQGDKHRSLQRIAYLEWTLSESTQAWLRARNAEQYNVYVSVNALANGARTRQRVCVGAVRHLFLDVDHDAAAVLDRIRCDPELPSASYVLHSSRARVHVFWRVRDFTQSDVELLQKHLAGRLRTDTAATSSTQLTRLPGFFNHKYREPYLVWVEYIDADRVYTPRDFPPVDREDSIPRETVVVQRVVRGSRGHMERAGAYISRVPPAIAGQHGDLHTFQTCCRVVRGFALDDDEALAVLAEWNARCQPPWTERELREKIRSARRNGREPIGGLL